MTDNLCPCGQPAPHATLCTDCHGTLKADLLAIRDHAEDLVDAMGKGFKFGNQGAKVVGKSPPLPIEPNATETYWIVRNVLTTWARTVLETWANLTPPDDRIEAIAEWLHDASDWFVKDPWVIELADEIADAKKQIIRAIDRPSDPQPLGQCGHVHDPERDHNGQTCGCACHYGAQGAIPCDPEDCNPGEPTIAAVVCTEQLKAPRDASEVRCKTCGTTHEAEVLRWRYLQAARELVLPMGELLAMMGAYTAQDREQLRKRINQWAKRGALGPERTVLRDDKGVKAYKLGEVLDKLSRVERMGGAV